jgi:hypothetical protein
MDYSARRRFQDAFESKILAMIATFEAKTREDRAETQATVSRQIDELI